MTRAHATPHSMVKALIRRQVPSRPLFIPLVFTLAAKLEDIPLPTFLTNPTKLANALTAVHRHLHTDGVACYFDFTLRAEALGYQLDWRTTPPAIIAPPPKNVSNLLQISPQELEQRGRIPVALEVVRRLRATLRDEPALLVGLAGPIRLGQQLDGPDFADRLAAHDDLAESLFYDLIDSVTVPLVQAFCRAGADIIFLSEVPVSPNVFDSWQTSLETVWNVIHFHEVLPVLSVNETELPAVLDGAPLICRPPEALAIPLLSNHPFGLALPKVEALPASLEQWLTSGRCAMITTQDEISYQTKIQDLERIVNTMRSAVKIAL